MYSKINDYAREVSNTVPHMSPLHVMKTAIQLHQMSPVTSGNSKDTAKVMPEIPLQPQEDKFDSALENLCSVLPHIPKTRLAAYLAEKEGNVNSVVEMILEETRDDHDCRVLDLAREQQNKVEDLATASVSTDMLKSILKTVEHEEEKTRCGQILSFHRPERSTCTTVANPLSHSLSFGSADTQDKVRFCPACGNVVDGTANFCSFCGQMLIKNYRRL